VSSGEKPGLGQIRNSNGPMLAATARSAGADVVELGIARDHRDELARWVNQGLAADVLVLSGGVSAGKFDLVPEVLRECGVEQVLHKVALRPGKPLWFGVKNDGARRVLVFGLPGNPVSSFVCFELFVRPAIAALGGHGFRGIQSVQAELSHDYEHAGGRAAYLPARVRASHGGAGKLSVEILPWRGSADLAALARANALVCLSAEKQTVALGAAVRIVPI
jgi:molybdopterin molybdotransferase